MFSLNSLIFIIIIINILCFNLNLKSQPECTLFMSYASDISNTTKHNTCVSIHPNVPPLGSAASRHGVAALLTERWRPRDHQRTEHKHVSQYYLASQQLKHYGGTSSRLPAWVMSVPFVTWQDISHSEQNAAPPSFRIHHQRGVSCIGNHLS